jgi:hypothetical protein
MQNPGPFFTYKWGGGGGGENAHSRLPHCSPAPHIYPLSLFNKIDLNCYSFLPLSNDKLLLIIYLFFVRFFFFYFKYS